MADEPWRLTEEEALAIERWVERCASGVPLTSTERVGRSLLRSLGVAVPVKKRGRKPGVRYPTHRVDTHARH